MEWVQLHLQYSVSGCRQYILHPQYSGTITPFSSQNHRRLVSCFINKLSQYSGQYHSKCSDKRAQNIRYWFYHSFILSLESWNPFTRAPSAASGFGLCTLHHNIPDVPTPVCHSLPKNLSVRLAIQQSAPRMSARQVGPTGCPKTGSGRTGCGAPRNVKSI